MATVYLAHNLSTDEVTSHENLATLVEVLSERGSEFKDYEWLKGASYQTNIANSEQLGKDAINMARALFQLHRDNNDLKSKVIDLGVVEEVPESRIILEVHVLKDGYDAGEHGLPDLNQLLADALNTEETSTFIDVVECIEYHTHMRLVDSDLDFE